MNEVLFDIMRTSSYVINVVRAARAVARWVRRWRKRFGTSSQALAAADVLQ